MNIMQINHLDLLNFIVIYVIICPYIYIYIVVYGCNAIADRYINVDISER